MVRVGVFGAGGRMGSTVCQAVADDPDLELVAAVDPGHVGESVCGVEVSGSADGLAEAGAQVAVDFTSAAPAMENLRWCAANGVHGVVGTSGLRDQDVAELRSLFTRSNCVWAPNFAIGAVLMIRFAELAAPWFETAEVVELHHNQKIDAPSGTAMHTVERMAAASAKWADDPTTKVVAEGARGATGPGGIHVHALRLQGMVAHQEVILGTTGQTLTVRHDSYDRTSFMPGVVLAVKKVADFPGVTVGLDAFLGL